MNADAYVTRAQAAWVTHVKPNTISQWRVRGWKTPEGEHRTLTVRSGPGRTLLFRLGDILDAERDTRLNPRARRARMLPAFLAV